MPKKGIETLIKDFISELSTKFKNFKGTLTEEFVVKDVWKCILDFQKKVNEDAGGSMLVDGRIRGFLFTVSAKKIGKVDFEKVKKVLENKESLKELEGIKHDGYSMSSLFDEILKKVESASNGDPDLCEDETIPYEIKKDNNEDDDLEILKFDKGQSKEIGKAIKNFKSKSSGIDKKMNAFNYLKSFWYYLIVCCNEIKKNQDGISDKSPNNERGLNSFYSQVEEVNGNSLDGNENVLVGGDEKIPSVINFLRNIKNLKGTGDKIDNPRIDILINQCNEALKIYSTKKNLENRKTKKSGDIIKSVENNLKMAFGGTNDPKKFHDSLQSAFEGLCDLAEMEGKNSSSSKKGLAGWYNKYKNSKDDEEVLEAIFGIKGYAKGAGFLGFGKTRLDKIWKIIEKSQKEVEEKIKSETTK